VGCQGDVYVVYGVQIPASIVWEHKKGRDGEDSAVIYCVNGHNVATDEWKIEHYQDEHPDEKIPTIAFYTEFHGPGYGANAMDTAKLSISILGDNALGMGTHHFKEKALIGYVVANECYVGEASECPRMNEIEAQTKRLIADIRDKLKLSVQPSDLRLHLYFDSLNGF
jgi:hypothetical protein